MTATLSLSGLTAEGTLILEVFVFPLMWLLWFGGLLTAAGGLYALRARRRPASSDPPHDPEPREMAAA